MIALQLSVAGRCTEVSNGVQVSESGVTFDEQMRCVWHGGPVYAEAVGRLKEKDREVPRPIALEG